MLESARRMRRTAVALLALNLMILSGGGAAVSLALFTDTRTVDANSFNVGTVELATSPTTALFNVTGMLPGASVTAALTVSNAGTADLRYALTTVATNPDSKGLRDQLTLQIRLKTANPCSTFDGTSLYSGSLAAAALGNPAPGSHAGDRALASSASEVLCFRVTLPAATGDAFQGATTVATFTFSAEQTANNP